MNNVRLGLVILYFCLYKIQSSLKLHFSALLGLVILIILVIITLQSLLKEKLKFYRDKGIFFYALPWIDQAKLTVTFRYISLIFCNRLLKAHKKLVNSIKLTSLANYELLYKEQSSFQHILCWQTTFFVYFVFAFLITNITSYLFMVIWLRMLRKNIKSIFSHYVPWHCHFGLRKAMPLIYRVIEV